MAASNALQIFGITLVGATPENVYWRLTDNWLELAVRILSPDHGTREIKDAMSRDILKQLRDILKQLDAAGIGIASAAYKITGLPTLTVERQGARA